MASLMRENRQVEDVPVVKSAALASPESGSWQRSGFPCIAGFEILGKLGRGGMGVVYKARQHDPDRIVALKIIRGTAEDNDEVVRQFRRETQAAARLSHGNIVQVFEAGPVGDTYYLAMECLDGVDLERLVQYNGPLPAERACDFIRQTAFGLQHAYEQGMVHRDIKPANLMLVRPSDEADPMTGDNSPDSNQDVDVNLDGTVKILDMGLARLYWGEGESSISQLTREGTVMGTPDFMAPEQVDDSHAVDIRADLYSLGCTFYFLLTGWVPFPCKSPLEKLDRHRWGRATPVERIRRDIPKPVGEIVRKLMAKRPEERFQTPAELIRALDVLSHPVSIAGRKDQPEQDAGRLLARSFDEEYERLQFVLADRLEQNELQQAGEVLDAMFRLKPNDSLIVSVRSFLNEQLSRQEPTGEVRRFEGHADWIWSVAFSADGNRIFSGGNDRVLRVWDARTGQALSVLTGHREAIKCLAVSPDGAHLVSTGKDRIIRLWNLCSGKEVQRFEGHANAVDCVAFSPNGRHLLSCSGKSIRLWDVDSGERLGRIAGHASEVKCVAFFPDGKRALSASWDHSVRSWDLDSGRETGRFDGAMNLFTSVAVSADGRRIAAGGSDQTIYLWDAQSGGEMGRLAGHGNWVTSVALSPDGRRALSGSQDATVRLWDVETRRELHRFEGHTNWVNCVAFSPDGRLALSGSADNTVRLWRLPRS